MIEVFRRMKSGTKKAVAATLAIGAAAALIVTSNNAKPDLDAELEAAIVAAGKTVDFYALSADRAPGTESNPHNIAKLNLGKALFFDENLAAATLGEENIGSISCATCHNMRKAGFSDMRQAVAEGGTGDSIMRVLNANFAGKPDVQMQRTPKILNVAWTCEDGVALNNGMAGAIGINEGVRDWGAEDLEGKPPSLNQRGFPGIEGQALFATVAHRLTEDIGLESKSEAEKRRDEYLESTYGSMFELAFPERNGEISAETTALAIACYERKVVSDRAPFVQWAAGEKRVMSDPQKRGAIAFFEAGCIECHNRPNFSGGFERLDWPDIDGRTHMLGRQEVTQNEEDAKKWRVPGLYNLSDAPGFGHGASFSNLSSAILGHGEHAADIPASAIDDLLEFINAGLHDGELYRYE